MTTITPGNSRNIMDPIKNQTEFKLGDTEDLLRARRGASMVYKCMPVSTKVMSPISIIPALTEVLANMEGITFITECVTTTKT